MKFTYTKDQNNLSCIPILFLTHKEYLSITGKVKWSKLKKIIFLHEFLIIKLFSFFNRTIIKISNKKSFNEAVKIIHWGVTLNEPIPYLKKYSHVHLLDKNSSLITNKHYGFALTLPITSKDFEPKNAFSEFSHDHFKWDVITVSHNSKRK